MSVRYLDSLSATPPDHLKENVGRPQESQEPHGDTATVKKPRERMHRRTGKATGVFEGHLLYRPTPTQPYHTMWCTFQSGARGVEVETELGAPTEWNPLQNDTVDRGTIDTAVQLTDRERHAWMIGTKRVLEIASKLPAEPRCEVLSNRLRMIDRKWTGEKNAETSLIAIEALR